MNHKYTILSRYNEALHGTDYKLLIGKWITDTNWIIRKHGLLSQDEFDYFIGCDSINLYTDSHGYTVDLIPPGHNNYKMFNTRDRISKNGLLCFLYRYSKRRYRKSGVRRS